MKQVDIFDGQIFDLHEESRIEKIEILHEINSF